MCDETEISFALRSRQVPGKATETIRVSSPSKQLHPLTNSGEKANQLRSTDKKIPRARKYDTPWLVGGTLNLVLWNRVGNDQLGTFARVVPGIKEQVIPTQVVVIVQGKTQAELCHARQVDTAEVAAAQVGR